MKSKLIVAAFALLLTLPSFAQKVISRKQFFTDTSLVVATLKTDFYKLSTDKKDTNYQHAVFTWRNADSMGDVSANIGVRLRGFFRRTQCSFAALMFNFRAENDTTRFGNFKRMKVAVPCEWGSEDEQYLMKEYMVYKIFQLFTDLSFRVRLMQIRFEDVSGKIKPYKQYAYAIEPIDDVAKRNGFVEAENRKVLSEQTNRLYTTMVSIFEYMIGNLDWAIPPQHNIKIVVPKDSAMAPPYIVPLDFDFSGVVNTLYATPPLDMKDIQSVTERRYRGFKRTMAEIKPIIARFLEKEQDVYAAINSFAYLKPANKKEMTDYLKGFFDQVRDEKNIQKIFIDGARVAQ